MRKGVVNTMKRSAVTCTKEPIPPSDTDQNTVADTPEVSETDTEAETAPETPNPTDHLRLGGVNIVGSLDDR